MTDAQPRSSLDEHVERAFDLLRHYRDFLVRTPGSPHDAECERAVGQLEGVLSRWLPLAHDAGDSVINGVAAIVGDRGAALAILRDQDLWQARKDCLVRLAEATIPGALSVSDAIVVCRREIQHWRTLLPRIWSKPNGDRYVSEADRETARAPGGYWSRGVESRPSILGASYFLARACDAVAVAAAGMKIIAPEVFRPTIQLAHELRAQPTWVAINPLALVPHLDTQLGLAAKVEQLMDEMEVLLIARASTDSHGTDKEPVQPTGDSMPLKFPQPVDAQHNPEEVNFADAMARYSRSYDDMRTMRLNPVKAIPLDQWSEKDGRRYTPYVLIVAVENERLAKQARVWWAWWETTQVDPSKAGPAPLVSPRIEGALRMAAARRAAESRMVTRAAADGASCPDHEKPIPDAAKDLAARSILAHFLANANTSTTTDKLYGVTGVSERKTEDLLRLMHSRCTRCPSDDAACPDHLGLLMHEPGKTRGWHMATDWGLEVARRQSPPPSAAAGNRETRR